MGKNIAVIGAGTMGTAAAWALAKRGVSVIAIDQFSHYNLLSSHGGHTRIFRHCYFEGEKYVPWAQESDRLFADLADRTGCAVATVDYRLAPEHPFPAAVGLLAAATNGPVRAAVKKTPFEKLLPQLRERIEELYSRPRPS